MAASDSRAASPDSERLLLAIFALIAAEHEERTTGGDARSVEAILAATGFTPGEVQRMTGGNRKTIESRMRRAKER